LQIQVTTPEVEAQSGLARTGLVTRTASNNDSTIAAILRAVEKKSTVNGRERIVLALDATDFPVYSFRSVAEAIRRAHSPAVASVGYEAVWIVGPSIELVAQIG
jgi:hypothetical protein